MIKNYKEYLLEDKGIFLSDSIVGMLIESVSCLIIKEFFLKYIVKLV